MIKRRCRNLDDAVILQTAVQPDNFAKHLPLPPEHEGLVVFAETTVLVNQFAQVFIALDDRAVKPGQVRPDLQVTDVFV